MRLSIQENVRLITKEKLPKVADWHRLRGKVTLSYALSKSGMNATKFGHEYVYNEERTESKLMDKWLNGKTTLYRYSAKRLETMLKGTLEIFELPLFELLANEPISVRRVNGMLNKYRATREDGAPFLYWKFPNHDEKLLNKTLIPVLFQYDTQTLFTCNDVYSFTTILGVVRFAEARGDGDLHLSAFKNLIRALPSVLRLPWIAPHSKLLLELIEDIRCRVLSTVLMFDIDWDIVWRQTNDPEHEPVRVRRPRDPIALRFIELEDPVLEAEIIFGAEVKRRRELKEKRLAKKKSESE